MSSKLSMAELLSIYKGKDKPAEFLNVNTILPGKTTLEKLEKLYTTRLGSLAPVPPDSSKGSSSSLSASQKEQRTVAICLVIVDELHHEGIWRRWLEEEEGQVGNTAANYDRGQYRERQLSVGEISSSSSSLQQFYDFRIQESEGRYKARLFIHAKYPDRIKSPWVRARTLDLTHNPDWNSPEVVRAMLSVLTEAVKDPNCKRFVFGTESCVPVYPLQEAGARLWDGDRSWLNARHKGETSWETAACFLSVDSGLIPPRAVWKALPGWVMLTRRHAEEILLLPVCVGEDLVVAWGKGGPWTEYSGSVYAPEEIYFPTMLSILGYLRDPVPPSSSSSSSRVGGGQGSGSGQGLGNRNGVLVEVEKRMVTYAEWGRKGQANPNTLTLTPFLVSNIRSLGCVFARKIPAGTCSVHQWEKAMKGAEEREQREEKGGLQGRDRDGDGVEGGERGNNYGVKKRKLN